MITWDDEEGAVTRTEMIIDTDDGPCRATLHTPDSGGPWPGVLSYPDAGGVRETVAGMAGRLASAGYAVLVPDVYHRTPYEPFDTATLFDDAEEFARLRALGATLTPERVAADAGLFVDALVGRAEVSGQRVGVIGYCFGGQATFRAAAARPDHVAVVASFHGGNLAVADDPDSPHHLADRIRAEVYVAAATDDAVFGPDQHERLRAAFDAAGVRGTIETYPAAHGFAVPDNPTYDVTADGRHQEALTTALASALPRPPTI